MKCFRPDRTQPSACPHGAGFDAGRVGSGLRLGDRNRAGALALNGGQQPALLLRLAARQQHLVDVAEGAPDQNVSRAPELLLDEARVDRREAAAAVLLRNVRGVEAERPRLLEDRARRRGVEAALLLHVLFQRQQLLLHEVPRRLDQQPLPVAEREVHRPLPSVRGFSTAPASRLRRRRCTSPGCDARAPSTETARGRRCPPAGPAGARAPSRSAGRALPRT